MKPTEQFARKILAIVPELHETYKAHIDNNDELLPHVFLGDITRFILHASKMIDQRDAITRLLKVLEDGLLSDQDEIVELVTVSFIENLCGEDEAIAFMHPQLGDTTKRALTAMCGYKFAPIDNSSHTKTGI